VSCYQEAVLPRSGAGHFFGLADRRCLALIQGSSSELRRALSKLCPWGAPAESRVWTPRDSSGSEPANYRPGDATQVGGRR
jgi:hypothetical protein